MFNRGTRYLEKNNYAKALALFKQQEKIYGRSKENCLNMGNCYRQLDDFEKSTQYYKLAADPMMPFLDGKFGEYPLALSNLGLLEYGKGNDDAAILYYERALAIKPDHLDAIWNYASAILRKWCSGDKVDLNLAWKAYQYRFNRSNPTPVDKSLPWWDGFSRGSSIIVLAEQGLGDKLMFGRYVSRLKEYFDEVWVQVPNMLNDIFSDYKCTEVVAKSGAKVCIPICELARIFGVIPGDWLRGKFEARDFGKRLKVGVVWSGSKTHANTRHRNTYSSYFLNLRKYADIYSLAPDVLCPKGIVNLNPKSWKETAENVLGMDLVICVDTSIVHLAGSLGVETWLLQPRFETDFRWGLGREDCMWYDSVRIIENTGSWDNVFARVEKMLAERALEHSRGNMLGGLTVEEYVKSIG